MYAAMNTVEKSTGLEVQRNHHAVQLDKIQHDRMFYSRIRISLTEHFALYAQSQLHLLHLPLLFLHFNIWTEHQRATESMHFMNHCYMQNVHPCGTADSAINQPFWNQCISTDSRL